MKENDTIAFIKFKEIIEKFDVSCKGERKGKTVWRVGNNIVSIKTNSRVSIDYLEDICESLGVSHWDLDAFL